jgi:hypothetical protein
MPQQSLSATHGSVRGPPGSLRREANKISKPIPITRDGKDGMAPQPLAASDQVPTASMGQTRESRSSTASASRRQTYGTVSSHTASSHTPQDSVSTSASHDSTVQRRRGSVLKNVMRKIFARKRQSQLDEGEDGGEPLTRTIRIEKGDDGTGADRVALVAVHGSPGSKGTASTENNKHSTVVSHLSSSSSDRLVRPGQDTSFPIPQRVPRRRATLPSLILSDEDARETALSVVAASSTRPSTAVSDEPQRSFDVRSRTSMQLHRRSQSADALRELVRRHRMSPIQWRRRSDERKFWRTSILDLDPPVRPQTSATMETTVTSEEKPIHGFENGDTAPPAGPEGAPFNFENLIGAMQDTDVTLEQRVNTLEVKLMDLEFAIAKIQGTTSDVFLGAAADRTPQKGTATRERHPITSTASEGSSQSSLSPVPDGRPISTGTLRPSMVYPQPPSWQTPSSSTTNLNGISIEQYTALVTLIRREQTARRTLEDQVSQLQEEMRRFRQASVLLGPSPGTYYPIPSPDPQDAREVRLHLMSQRKHDWPLRGSETESNGDHHDSRQWDVSYYRSSAEVAPRNAMAGMI